MESEEWTRQEVMERDALIMANARRIIKAHKATSNGRLYMELFGTGFGTARSRCRDLGCNPDIHITDYSMMIDFIRANQPLTQ